jgi:hypothetical protein
LHSLLFLFNNLKRMLWFLFVYSVTQGLMVLTLHGESFPSRVGVSLYQSMLTGLTGLTGSGADASDDDCDDDDSGRGGGSQAKAYPRGSSAATSTASATSTSVQPLRATPASASSAQFLNDLLVVDGAKQFVDMAVRLVRRSQGRGQEQEQVESKSPPAAAATVSPLPLPAAPVAERSVVARLTRMVDVRKGLFDTPRNVRVFVRGMQALREVAAVEEARDQQQGPAGDTMGMYGSGPKPRSNVIIL